jgi:hypothetical protein
MKWGSDVGAAKVAARLRHWAAQLARPAFFEPCGWLSKAAETNASLI